MPLTEEQQAEVQAEVQRIAAGIRDEARTQGAAARQAEIDAFLAEQAEAQRIAALEGEEQLRAQAAAADARARAAEEDRDRIAAQAAARTALLAAGFAPDHVDDALVLLGPVQPDELDDAVPALAERLPALLFSSTGSGETPPPGVPPAKQKKGAGGKTPAERAKDRFAATQTPLAKSA